MQRSAFFHEPHILLLAVELPYSDGAHEPEREHLIECARYFPMDVIHVHGLEGVEGFETWRKVRENLVADARAALFICSDLIRSFFMDDRIGLLLHPQEGDHGAQEGPYAAAGL